MTLSMRTRSYLVLAAVGVCALLAATTSAAERTFVAVDLSPTVGGYAFHAACIQYADLKLNIQGKMKPAPVLALYSKGLHASVYDRAEAVARNLELAMDLLDQGGRFILRTDRLGNPGIWVTTPTDNYGKGVEIITIFAEDAERMPMFRGDRHALATYAKTLFQAHYLLFIKESVTAEEYDQLVKSDGGAAAIVFREIFA